MEADSGQLIAAVHPGSIAEDLGIVPGDRLTAINEQPVRDVFDYQTRQAADQLLLTIRKTDGEVILFDIEKDEEEDLGLDFANPMLDDCRNCHNRCVFCFIDQLPSGMRPSLYLKDDDLRLSFLSGNYVTLTNITSDELDRIIEYRFSPLNISVHATDSAVRRKMMRNRHAGNLMHALHRIAQAGIRINAQIVLVPGYNDQAVLEKTIEDLTGLSPAIQSIAIVPVGITRYRDENKLIPLRRVQESDARAILDLVHTWQRRLLAAGSSRVLYAADEFYLIAGRPFPEAADYEDYPQLENGVGMCALFLDDLQRGIGQRHRDPDWQMTQSGSQCETFDPILLVTGTAAGPILKEAAGQLQMLYRRPVDVLMVKNRFFGETITVAGLLTGQDILAALLDHQAPASAERNGGHTTARPTVILPENQLRAGTEWFLDDETLTGLRTRTGLTVQTTAPNADSLLLLLDRLNGHGEPLEPDLPSAASGFSMKGETPS